MAIQIAEPAPDRRTRPRSVNEDSKANIRQCGGGESTVVEGARTTKRAHLDK